MNNARAHILVSGRVQGVFFRAGAQARAKKIGVYGFVRNLPDARVEILAEGEKENVEKVINWLKRGSLFAKVKKVEIIWEEYRGEFKEFNIIY